MGKDACIKRMAAVRNYSKNTVMKKANKQRGEAWRVKGMKFSEIK